MNSNRRSPSIRLLALILSSFALAGISFAAGPQEKLLYSFQGFSAPNGQDREGPGDLISDEQGNLYGVTVWGGICNIPHHLSYQCATVWRRLLRTCLLLGASLFFGGGLQYHQSGSAFVARPFP
jgi:hypothetical protein